MKNAIGVKTPKKITASKNELAIILKIPNNLNFYSFLYLASPLTSGIKRMKASNHANISIVTLNMINIFVCFGIKASQEPMSQLSLSLDEYNFISHTDELTSFSLEDHPELPLFLELENKIPIRTYCAVISSKYAEPVFRRP